MNIGELPEKIEAGQEVEVQLAPRGAWPQIVDGEEVRQIVDDEAIKSLINTFDKEVLVDSDHDSETGKGTEAMAWVTRVFEDPDRGLVGIFKFTDKGADAVTNRRYRFISPAWTLDDETHRPIKLVSVGMTNRPNLPVAPVLNMRAVNAVAVAEAVPTAVNSEEKIMDQIKEALGLPPEATDEEVLTAIEALKANCGSAQENTDAVNAALGLDETATNEDAVECINAMKTQLGDMQEAAANAEADQFVAENEDVATTDEEKVELKNAYLEDPEKAQETVANARAIAQRIIANSKIVAERKVERIVNSRVAKTPTVVNTFEAGMAACNSLAEEQAFIKKMFNKR